MQHVRFQPWIGSKYVAGNRFGKRVLVLGESHYADASEATPDITTRVVRTYGQLQRKIAFFTKVPKILLQMDASTFLTDEDKAEAWEHVAFYNYVQELVGPDPRKPPTSEQWAAAQPPFREVVESLRPQIVLVLGIALGRQLPALPASITTCNVQHPSSSAFSYAKSNPRFAEALALANA